MDGEHHGKHSFFLMDDLGGKLNPTIFGNILFCIISKSFSLTTSPGKTSPVSVHPSPWRWRLQARWRSTWRVPHPCVKGPKKWMEFLFNGVSWYILPIGWFFCLPPKKGNQKKPIDLLTSYFVKFKKGWHTYSFGQILENVCLGCFSWVEQQIFRMANC